MPFEPITPEHLPPELTDEERRSMIGRIDPMYGGAERTSLTLGPPSLYERSSTSPNPLATPASSSEGRKKIDIAPPVLPIRERERLSIKPPETLNRSNTSPSSLSSVSSHTPVREKLTLPKVEAPVRRDTSHPAPIESGRTPTKIDIPKLDRPRFDYRASTLSPIHQPSTPGRSSHSGPKSPEMMDPLDIPESRFFNDMQQSKGQLTTFNPFGD